MSGEIPKPSHVSDAEWQLHRKYVESFRGNRVRDAVAVVRETVEVTLVDAAEIEVEKPKTDVEIYRGYVEDKNMGEVDVAEQRRTFEQVQNAIDADVITPPANWTSVGTQLA